MVLSLSIPGFSTSRPADSAAAAPAPQSRRHRSSTSTTASASSSSPSGRNSYWRSSGASGESASASNNGNSHSLTLSEALRNNPFGSTSRPRSVQVSIHEKGEQRREQDELNAALETLARVFPDVQIEVFRELLVRFDGRSRLQVSVEQLLRHKKEWVAGRWNVPEGQGKEEGGNTDKAGHALATEQGQIMDEESLVPPEERFRSEEYKVAVRVALSREFSSLSKSTIDGVLAEVNFGYMRARPVLRDLSRRTWRATIINVLPTFKRRKDKEEHPLLLWQRYADGEVVPRLKETGSAELDDELRASILNPLVQQKREEQELGDFQFATALNEKEARAANALYECECCFADVTFEEISTCSANAHVICYCCIQRTISEALFGQGWARSVDLEHSTLKCIAPISTGACDGCLHPQVVRRAILLDKAGDETFRKFEVRLASEALLSSQLKLIRCPFCSYAEADPVHHPTPRGITWRFRHHGGLIPTIVITIILLDLFPLFLVPILIALLLDARAVKEIFYNALRHLSIKTRSKRFTCANPSCQRVSCLTCQKLWRDPHVCHEPLLSDLRATVEAARTAAVKRTCPRCGLSFVKSSGCNKLTCVCGYSMCYLCRKALGPPIRPARRGRQRPRREPGLFDGPADDLYAAMLDAQDGDNIYDDEFEEPEGYKHFCEHFRINPGSRCTECSKCDLYQTEDEEAVARRAGEKAERAWRLRHSSSSASTEALTIGLRNINEDLSAGADGSTAARRASSLLWDLQFPDPSRSWRYWLRDVWMDGRWRMEGQALVDWVVDWAIVIEDV